MDRISDSGSDDRSSNLLGFTSPLRPVRVLSIAGSDSGGGAGLQADIKTVSSLGGFSATAVSAVTVQNTMGVEAVYNIPVETVCAQVEAVCRDIEPQAVKISMLPDPALAKPLREVLLKYRCKHIVIDPVMVATSGHSLVDMPAVKALVEYLFPLAEILTPNLEEARVLSGIEPRVEEDYRRMAEEILKTGAASVLIKGGHAQGSDTMNDLLLCRAETEKPYRFSAPRIETANLHGTGCTLSAAIAFFLAKGEALPRAVSFAKDYIQCAIEAGKNMSVGHGHGPVNHFFAPKPLKAR